MHGHGPEAAGVDAPPVEPVHVTICRTLTDMQRLAPAWQSLEARSCNDFAWFQTSTWCLAWMQHQAGKVCHPFVLALWTGSVLEAVWPLMIERKRGGLRVLRALGEPHTQYATILCRNGTLRDDQRTALVTAALSARTADTAVIRSVPHQSILAQVLPRATDMPDMRTEAALLDLRGYATSADFFSSLDGNHRRKRARRRNALARRGAIGFCALRPNDDGFPEAIDTCLAFKREWLARTGRYSLGLSIPGHAGFLAALQSGSSGDPLAFVLTVDGKPVAIEIGFLRHGHYYAYLGGFDWAWRDLSPGKVQMEMTVCWLIDAGATTYDLLANPTGYKETWTNRTIALETHIADLTAWGRLYSRLWVNGAWPLLKAVYHAVPAPLRAGVKLVVEKKAWFVA